MYGKNPIQKSGFRFFFPIFFFMYGKTSFGNSNNLFRNAVVVEFKFSNKNRKTEKSGSLVGVVLC